MVEITVVTKIGPMKSERFLFKSREMSLNVVIRETSDFLPLAGFSPRILCNTVRSAKNSLGMM